MEGEAERGETGETCETGEKFDLFRRGMPDLDGTELKISNSPRSNPERRSNNNTLTGLPGLTGLADHPRLAYRVANEPQEPPRSDLTHDIRQRNSYVREASPHRFALRR